MLKILRDAGEHLHIWYLVINNPVALVEYKLEIWINFLFVNHKSEWNETNVRQAVENAYSGFICIILRKRGQGKKYPFMKNGLSLVLSTVIQSFFLLRKYLKCLTRWETIEMEVSIVFKVLQFRELKWEACIDIRFSIICQVYPNYFLNFLDTLTNILYLY